VLSIGEVPEGPKVIVAIVGDEVEVKGAKFLANAAPYPLHDALYNGLALQGSTVYIKLAEKFPNEEPVPEALP
jgi:hypothetical protein